MMAVVGMADQTKVLASGLQIDVAAAFQNGGRKTLLALIADSGKIVQ